MINTELIQASTHGGNSIDGGEPAEISFREWYTSLYEDPLQAIYVYLLISAFLVQDHS